MQFFFITIAEELPKRFSKWVNKLYIRTDDRPLRNILGAGLVLNFNYTEFVETLYGVDKSNVCYIHGCRRKIKGQPRDNLILGHMPGDSKHGILAVMVKMMYNKQKNL